MQILFKTFNMEVSRDVNNDIFFQRDKTLKSQISVDKLWHYLKIPFKERKSGEKAFYSHRRLYSRTQEKSSLRFSLLCGHRVSGQRRQPRSQARFQDMFAVDCARKVEVRCEERRVQVESRSLSPLGAHRRAIFSFLFRTLLLLGVPLIPFHRHSPTHDAYSLLKNRYFLQIPLSIILPSSAFLGYYLRFPLFFLSLSICLSICLDRNLPFRIFFKSLDLSAFHYFCL